MNEGVEWTVSAVGIRGIVFRVYELDVFRKHVNYRSTVIPKYPELNRIIGNPLNFEFRDDVAKTN